MSEFISSISGASDGSYFHPMLDDDGNLHGVVLVMVAQSEFQAAQWGSTEEKKKREEEDEHYFKVWMEDNVFKTFRKISEVETFIKKYGYHLGSRQEMAAFNNFMANQGGGEAIMGKSYRSREEAETDLEERLEKWREQSRKVGLILGTGAVAQHLSESKNLFSTLYNPDTGLQILGSGAVAAKFKKGMQEKSMEQIVADVKAINELMNPELERVAD